MIIITRIECPGYVSEVLNDFVLTNSHAKDRSTLEPVSNLLLCQEWNNIKVLWCYALRSELQNFVVVSKVSISQSQPNFDTEFKEFCEIGPN